MEAREIVGVIVIVVVFGMRSVVGIYHFFRGGPGYRVRLLSALLSNCICVPILYWTAIVDPMVVGIVAVIFAALGVPACFYVTWLEDGYHRGFGRHFGFSKIYDPKSLEEKRIDVDRDSQNSPESLSPSGWTMTYETRLPLV